MALAPEAPRLPALPRTGRPGLLALAPLLALTLVAAGATGCRHAQPPAGATHQIVARIEIRGLKHVKPKDVLEKLGTEKQPWYPFARKRWYSPFVFAQDQQRVVQFLKERGFFEARVRNVEVKELAGGKKVHLIIHVEEGPPARVTKLELRGIDPLPPDARRRVLWKFPVVEGQRFDYGSFRRAEPRLRARLRNLGYATAQVESRAFVDPDRRRVTVVFEVSLGSIASFGETRIRGLERVPEVRVRERVLWKPGDRFKPAMVELTRARIFELGVFSVVNLKEKPRPGKPDIIDIDIRVRETLFRNLKLGVGIGVDSARQEAHVQGIWRHNNFLGGLRRLELTLKPGYAVLPNVVDIQAHGPLLKVSAELTQPGAFGWSGLNWKTRVEYELSIQQGYQFQGPRLRTGFERLFAPYVTVSLSYNFDFTDFYNVDPTLFDPLRTPLGLGFVDPYVLGYLEQRLVVDLRNDPLKPRYGGYLAVTLDEAADQLGSNFSYFKFHADLRGYLSFHRRVVGAARFQIGSMIPFGGGDTPVLQRFYGGGASDNRGFGYRRLSPLVEGSMPGQTLPIGGLSLVAYTIELRVRTWRQLYAVVFHDAGDVSPDALDFRFGRLEYQVGAGLRYVTPIGPVRLDVGVRPGNIRPPAADPGARYAFQFSIGEAF